MRGTFKRVFIGLAATLAVSGAAVAADVAPIVPAPPPPVVVPPPAPVFDWSGPYVGTRTQALFCSGICWANIEGHAGYSLVLNRILVGIDVGAGWWTEFGSGGWSANASARTGVILGRALAYGRVGYAAYGAGGVNQYLTFGAGAELAVGRSISVFAEFAGERYFRGGTSLGVAAGVNFHFGN